jgi:cytochrome P450
MLVFSATRALCTATSNLLAWLFYELGQHPEVWDECKREVDDVLQRRAPDSDSLEQLTLIGMDGDCL